MAGFGGAGARRRALIVALITPLACGIRLDEHTVAPGGGGADDDTPVFEFPGSASTIDSPLGYKQVSRR